MDEFFVEIIVGILEKYTNKSFTSISLTNLHSSQIKVFYLTTN